MILPDKGPPLDNYDDMHMMMIMMMTFSSFKMIAMITKVMHSMMTMMRMMTMTLQQILPGIGPPLPAHSFSTVRTGGIRPE